jgi:Xaa-Pro aminopeptidase
MQATGISGGELADRRGRLLEQAGTTTVLFGQAYIQYYTGFDFLSNERPVVVVVGDELLAFVPEFEVARTEAEGHFDRVESYPEYPGPEHPMTVLGRLLSGPLAADEDGYPGILGYEGPALSEVTGAPVDVVGGWIERQLRIKSPAEVELIRQSARWCEHAHRLLQEYSVPGATEAEASLRAGLEATLAMLRRSGPSTPASSARRTAPPPATAARSALAARGRTRSRTTSSSARATCSSPRRPLLSGATTPSSSAAW